MKKTSNKKGFTLAELLIVVGIIAVLMGIAVPVFTAQLRKAELATDHSNIRSVYPMARYADLTGSLSVVGTSVREETTGTFWFATNGDITDVKANAYLLQTNGSATDCVGGADGHTETMHVEGNRIAVTHNGTNWEITSDNS